MIVAGSLRHVFSLPGSRIEVPSAQTLLLGMLHQSGQTIFDLCELHSFTMQLWVSNPPQSTLPPGSSEPTPSKMSPFSDEEAEAVKNIPPTPVEVEEAVSQILPTSICQCQVKRGWISQLAR